MLCLADIVWSTRFDPGSELPTATVVLLDGLLLLVGIIV